MYLSCCFWVHGLLTAGLKTEYKSAVLVAGDNDNV